MPNTPLVNNDAGEFTEITNNNVRQALPINELITKLRANLQTMEQFNLVEALDGIITEKRIESKKNSSINFLVPYAELSNALKTLKDQSIRLNKLFSSYPAGIVYYFINIYLAIFNGNFKDTEIHQLLTNIANSDIIDELKYTAYNQVSPFDMYNELNGNDLLVNHLRCFFNIQPCFPEFENARERNLFFGFIKSGPKKTGILGIFSKLTQKFTNVGGHMNSFIIDKTKRLIIHFEPKGEGISAYKSFNLKQFICRVAGEIFEPTSNTISIKGVEYTFIDTKELKMVQSSSLNFDIFCQTYSILAILIYILNIEKIHGLPGAFEIITMFKNITYADASRFRNFFTNICIDDYMRLLARQQASIISGDPQYSVGESQQSVNNSFELAGGMKITRKYKIRKPARIRLSRKHIRRV